MDDRQDGTVEAAVQEAPALSAQAIRRLDLLGTHIVQLQEIHAAGGDLREALAGIELDAWELEQLALDLSGAPLPWGHLVSEGVAFRNKCQTDIGWGPNAQQLSVEELNDFREVLIADAAMGLALLEECQQALNQLIRNGDMDTVKKLTAFRNKISQCVNELKGTIGESGFAEATSTSEELITPVDMAAWTGCETSASAPAPTPTPTPSINRPAPGRVVFKEESEPGSNHIKPLLMLLGLAVVVWGVFILPKLTVKTVQTLTVNDISPRSEIRHVVAKPPSLYVELSTSAWRALSDTQRLELLDDVGRTSAAAGYNGAHFTLEDGTTAGQWLKEHGSRLGN